eukprot:CAMPEP_0198250454 /NCGR_PEP_ID=MMETSP1447-20131203/1645_1 /TAXON_ID=420782 /ORGANISM="Chaetoceros dichaeta, Strain CCMP1751" /LENGTH=179 /DNA_ID=CAMNT_0043935295 /DNA_START=1 /DNA_END=536 /DNA_ORIENTATION=+
MRTKQSNNNNNNNNDERQYQQRPTSSNLSNSNSNSFLDIQHEQERESSYSNRPSNIPHNNDTRRGTNGSSLSSAAAANSAGGGSRGGGLRGSTGGRTDHPNRGGGTTVPHRRTPSYHRTNSGPNLNDMPLEQGRIHTLLDNFGFIYCADRPVELFFHYSEFAGNSHDLNVGDEVEFYVG